MHELREDEADGKEVDLSKLNPVLIAQIRSLADQAIGKSPRLDMTKVGN